MARNLFDLSWPVPKNGFEWAASDGEPVLRPRSASLRKFGLDEGCRQLPVRSQHPLRQHTALFTRFASVEPVRSEILEFANEYGSLTRSGNSPLGLPDRDDPDTLVPLAGGESFALWVREIGAMSRAVELWRLTTADDHAELARRILWSEDNHKNPVVAYVANPDARPPSKPYQLDQRGIEVIASATERPEWMEHFQPGDLIAPAFHYLSVIANGRLQGGLDNDVEKGTVMPRLEWDRAKRATYVQFVPDSLLGALWLQFASATSGGKSTGSASAANVCSRFRPTPIGRAGSIARMRVKPVRTGRDTTRPGSSSTTAGPSIELPRVEPRPPRRWGGIKGVKE